MNRRKFIHRAAITGTAVVSGASLLACDTSAVGKIEETDAFAKAPT